MFKNNEAAAGFRGFSEPCGCFIPSNLQVLWDGCEAECVPVSGDIQSTSTAAAISVNGLNPPHQAENILLLIVYQPPPRTSGRMMHPRRGASSNATPRDKQIRN